MKKGFTLIELLIVVGVLGVLAAGVVVAINPGKRIKQANDTKIKNDVGQIATALQAYYAFNQLYPASLSVLETSGDLKKVPSGSGTTCAAYSYGRTGTCTITSCEAQVSCALNDPTAGLGTWCWRSATGTAVEAASCAP